LSWSLYSYKKTKEEVNSISLLLLESTLLQNPTGKDTAHHGINLPTKQGAWTYREAARAGGILVEGDDAVLRGGDEVVEI
jgi:hypothetical protein